MKLGPTVWQGIKIEREIWLCTPGMMRQIERSKWRKKEQRLWEKEQHEREKINPIFPNSRYLHEWFKPMLQNQIYPWNYQAMPKKIQRKKKGQWRYFGFDIVSSIIVTKRENEKEMKLGPTVWQGTKIERDIWLCTPGMMRQIERTKWREREQRLWEEEKHEREKINPIFSNSRYLHE